MSRKHQKMSKRIRFGQTGGKRHTKYAIKIKTDKSKDWKGVEYYNSDYFDCVMCGKSGGSMRSDGRIYCSHCWQVWNS